MATSKALCSGLDPDRGAPWAYHPFGRRLLKSLYVTRGVYFILSKKKVSAVIICLKIIWKHDIIFFFF